MEKSEILQKELNDEDLETVGGGFDLVFRDRDGCPFCGPRVTLLGSQEKECFWCGRKSTSRDNAEVTDLRYYTKNNGPKTTIL